MAENTEKKVLVEVEITATEALDALTDLKMKSDELRDAQKKLDTSTKEGRLQYEELGQKIKALNTEAQKYQHEIQKSVQANKSEAGSIAQMRAELSKATAKYVKMSAAEREDSAGKEKLSLIKAQSDELKELENMMLLIFEFGFQRRQLGS